MAGLPDDWPVLALGVGLLVAAVLPAAVRIAGPRERIVVVRRGRSRVAGPGLVLTVPGLERPHRVCVAPRRLTTSVGRARTGDGVDVFLTLTVVFRVVDPTRVTAVDAGVWVERCVDDAVRARLVGTGLADLAVASPVFADRVRRTANGLVAADGLRVDGVTVDDVELTVGADLLRWAGRA